jgi:transcriptional regulator with XRE-family HTH domain
MTATTGRRGATRSVGDLLREWRERRRLSQLDLSIQADVSTRHLSFVETGRARPSTEMILRLAEQLEIPLRERNALLLAGGYAPVYPQRGLDAPELDAVRAALGKVLAGHDPYPALVVNRWWELVDSNSPVALLTDDCAAWLLEPPVNVLRLSLHPEGMSPRIANLPQWRTHLLSRLLRQAHLTGDQTLLDLHTELSAYPGGSTGIPGHTDVVVSLKYRARDRELSFFSMTSVIGTPTDITVEELTIEAFFPADDATARALRKHT